MPIYPLGTIPKNYTDNGRIPFPLLRGEKETCNEGLASEVCETGVNRGRGPSAVQAIFTIVPYRFHIQMSLNFGQIWQGMPNDVSWLLNNLTSSEPQPSRSQPVSLSLRYYLLPPVFTCLGGLSWKYTIINGLGQQSHK